MIAHFFDVQLRWACGRHVLGQTNLVQHKNPFMFSHCVLENMAEKYNENIHQNRSCEEAKIKPH